MSHLRPEVTKARAVELIGSGLSVRQTLERLTTEGHRASVGSISAWARGSRPARPKPPPRVQAPVYEPTRVTASTKGVSIDPHTPADVEIEIDLETPSDDEVIRLPVAALALAIRRISARLDKELLAPVANTTIISALGKEHERLAKALVLARPPAQFDPEKDPTSIEARAIVLAKIKRLIEKAPLQANA